MAYDFKFKLVPRNGAAPVHKGVVLNKKGQPLLISGGGWDGISVTPLSCADYELHIRQVDGSYKQVGF